MHNPIWLPRRLHGLVLVKLQRSAVVGDRLVTPAEFLVDLRPGIEAGSFRLQHHGLFGIGLS
jgi:hypothetical protein